MSLNTKAPSASARPAAANVNTTGRSSAPSKVVPNTASCLSQGHSALAQLHPRSSSTSPDPSLADDNDNDVTIRPAREAPSPQNLVPQPIQDLDHQIAALGSQVDAFQTERKRLGKFIFVGDDAPAPVSFSFVLSTSAHALHPCVA